ncbi:MAG: Clp protease ClpP [bacterium]|nr:Clp protease ClpP [bacterium]
MWMSEYELARKRADDEKPKRSAHWRAFGSDDDEAAHKSVEVMHNHIYFYADVDNESGIKLLRVLHKLDRELRIVHLLRDDPNIPEVPIWLHVNSYGGSLFTGFSLADQLSMVKSPLYTVMEGICASAATLIALSGRKRYILPNSFLLIHQLSALIWGTHEQFKDEMTMQQKAMERLVMFYATRTRVSADEVRSMLTHDYWLDAEGALANGFADEILR